MKKILLTSLVATLISTSSIADELVIGAPMSSFADKWATYMHDAIREYDAANDDVVIKLSDANEDPGKMLNDVENFIDTGVDAILLMPTDPATVKPIAKKAKRAGIPLIVVNRVPNEDDMKNVTAYVGSNSIQAGLIQGEEVAKMVGDKQANVAIIMGTLGHEAQIERTKGNKEVFAKYDNITIVNEQEGKWDRAKGLQIAEDLLQSSDDINVIVANNDEMAIGALLAASKAGLSDEDLIIAGVDATPDALEYLGEGLDITVFQSAGGQGKKAAEVAHKAAKGEEVEQLNYVDYELVLPENKAEYLDKY